MTTTAKATIRALVALLLALLLCPPTAAQEKSADAAAAEALFSEGLRLKKAGDYAKALERFRRSDVLGSALGTKLNIADCLDKLGKTASAWHVFREVADLAGARGLAEPEKIANERAAALAPQLSKLVIEVPLESRHAKLVVRRDGQTVAALVWGTALPVDPGAHEISASAPGYLPWSTRVQIGSAQPTRTIVGPARQPAPSKPGGDKTPPPPPPPPPPTTSWPPMRVAGVTVGAVGVAALGVGIGLGLHALSIRDDSNDQRYCDEETGFCDETGIDMRLEARDFGNASTALFIIGGAAISAGLVLSLVATDEPATVALQCSPAGLAASCQWRF